jgi:hypothetical protein
MAVNEENAPALLKDPRCHAMRYRASLYADRKEVFPEAIAEALKAPGEAVIVDDPRGVLHALGRSIGHPSRTPLAPRPVPLSRQADARSDATLLSILADDPEWNQLPQTPAARADKAQKIVRQAQAAEEIPRRGRATAELVTALERRVRHRSLHPEWRYHGLDGGTALRALLEMHSSGAIELARECLWRDDPEVEPVIDPTWNVPRSWGDFRTKAIVFGLLSQIKGAATEQLCRDYLALSDDEARRIGSLQFEAAAQALLEASPQQATALELLRHRRADVRGRVILTCLANIDQPYALHALEQGAPHALAYRPAKR